MDTLVTDLDANVRDTLIDAALLEKELIGRVSVARGTTGGQAFTSQTVALATFALVGGWILNELIRTGGQALVLMQEEELVDTTLGALVSPLCAFEACRVALFAPVSGRVVIAIGSTFFNTSIHLEERSEICVAI